MLAICERTTETPPACPQGSCSRALGSESEQNRTDDPTALNAITQYAAYCLGALNEILPQGMIVKGPDGKAFLFPNGTPNDSIDAQMSKAYGVKRSTPDSQSSDLVPSIKPLSSAENNSRKRMDRYDRYIKGVRQRTWLSSDDTRARMVILGQIKAIETHGKKDAEKSKRSMAANEYANCQVRCDTQTQCLVDCVETYDVTAAKVLGCQILPDRLPY